MPKLICDVHNCKFNYDLMCSKYSIDVDGVESKCKRDTKCASFKVKDESNLNYEFANLDKIASPNTEVYCDVVKCVFERGQRCYADKVVIKKLSTKDESVITNSFTSCETFESKD